MKYKIQIITKYVTLTIFDFLLNHAFFLRKDSRGIKHFKMVFNYLMNKQLNSNISMYFKMNLIEQLR